MTQRWKRLQGVPSPGLEEPGPRGGPGQWTLGSEVQVSVPAGTQRKGLRRGGRETSREETHHPRKMGSPKHRVLVTDVPPPSPTKPSALSSSASHRAREPLPLLKASSSLALFTNWTVWPVFFLSHFKYVISHKNMTLKWQWVHKNMCGNWYYCQKEQCWHTSILLSAGDAFFWEAGYKSSAIHSERLPAFQNSLSAGRCSALLVST